MRLLLELRGEAGAFRTAGESGRAQKTCGVPLRCATERVSLFAASVAEASAARVRFRPAAAAAGLESELDAECDMALTDTAGKCPLAVLQLICVQRE